MIEVWSEMAVEDAEERMPQEILERLGHHVASHPWWLARARLVSCLIDRELGPGAHQVLDVGCGWGVTLDHLERAGHHVTGMDIGRGGLEKLAKPGRRLILGDIESGPIPESAKSRFDAVLALDVLEHLDDDAGALRNLASLARPGGLVILTVPARPDLWSEFDTVQGHKRRYLRQEFQGMIEGSGLFGRIRVMSCWPWLVPLARLSRRRSVRYGSASNSEIYERYVRPPAMPVRWGMNALFRFSERRILAGGEADGSSLLACARR
ncbi:methyltransferase domain-containing protein [bacterium]|nr:methyltransferase domain-containing protein [bacterium]